MTIFRHPRRVILTGFGNPSTPKNIFLSAPATLAICWRKSLLPSPAPTGLSHVMPPPATPTPDHRKRSAQQLRRLAEPSTGHLAAPAPSFLVAGSRNMPAPTQTVQGALDKKFAFPHLTTPDNPVFFAISPRKKTRNQLRPRETQPNPRPQSSPCTRHHNR